ncbi:uncharacterized protein LOC130685830 isoform X1 [Daphnia carinata]|uniref:uncharacterized protein LOC130685830 isoform X1 n=2 Tax=Daphnia carinata TaxID=120202 RepID=UPI0025794F55|nr:uncharacterized protein LOC130685830 isoform X1 [Daphnia carinata]XP_057365092.1 uncharacterized protein LOC130685830 isoform X1 [Daphnia carinata]
MARDLLSSNALFSTPHKKKLKSNCDDIAYSAMHNHLHDNEPSNDVSSRRTTRSISRNQARDVVSEEISATTNGVDSFLTKNNLSTIELAGTNIRQISSGSQIPHQILATSNTMPSSEIVKVKRGRGRPRKYPKPESVPAVVPYTAVLNQPSLDVLNNFRFHSMDSGASIADSCATKGPEEVPCMEQNFSSGSIPPSDETIFISLHNFGNSLRNDKQWGPLSCRQPVEEEILEIPDNIHEPVKEVRFAETLLKQSKKIGTHNDIDLYAIPLVKLGNLFSSVERFTFGEANNQTEQRIALVFGENTSKQMDFINCIANYVLGVEKEDKFRFQVTQLEAIYQVNCIKVYTFHHTEGYRVPYSLTVVAMPSNYSACDSELFNDQRTAKEFLEFLKDKDGIQELDMICNVTAVTDVSQQSFLSIFGNDVDGIVSTWQPISCVGDTSSWQETMQSFFTSLAERKKKSLRLTKQVLEERKQMEATVDGLRPLIKVGCVKMEEISKTKKMIVFCQAQIQSSDETLEKFQVELTQKVDLPAGQYVNNCTQCYVTCGSNSSMKKENEGMSSSNLSDSVVAVSCSACPGKCNSDMHAIQPFRWVYVKKEPINLSDPANQRYEAEMKWKSIKSTGRDLVAVLQSDLVENGTMMLEQFQTIWRCIQRMNKIALRGNSFLTQRVFDLLYDAEQQLKQLEFDDGLECLKILEH